MSTMFLRSGAFRGIARNLLTQKVGNKSKTFSTVADHTIRLTFVDYEVS